MLLMWMFGVQGSFMRNMEGHNAVINCLALNQDNVLVSGGDNGSLAFVDGGVFS
jgi:pleiotropic regulator 1